MNKYITLLTLSLLSSFSLAEAAKFDLFTATDEQLAGKISKLKKKQETAEQAEHEILGDQIQALEGYRESKNLPDGDEVKEISLGSAMEAYFAAKEKRTLLFKNGAKHELASTAEEITQEVDYGKVLNNLKKEPVDTFDSAEQALIQTQIEALSNYLKSKDLLTEEEDFKKILIESALGAYYKAESQRAKLKNKKSTKDEIPLVNKKKIRKEAPFSPKLSWNQLEELMGDDEDFVQENERWAYENSIAFGAALTGKNNLRSLTIKATSQKAELIEKNSKNEDLAQFAKQHPEFIGRYAVVYKVDTIAAPFFLVLKD